MSTEVMRVKGQSGPEAEGRRAGSSRLGKTECILPVGLAAALKGVRQFPVRECEDNDNDPLECQQVRFYVSSCH